MDRCPFNVIVLIIGRDRQGYLCRETDERARKFLHGLSQLNRWWRSKVARFTTVYGTDLSWDVSSGLWNWEWPRLTTMHKMTLSLEQVSEYNQTGGIDGVGWPSLLNYHESSLPCQLSAM